MKNLAEFDKAMMMELGSRVGNDLLLENAAIVGAAHVQRKLEAAGPIRLVGDYVYTQYHEDFTWYFVDGFSTFPEGNRLSCIELDEGWNQTDKEWWIAPQIVRVI